MGFVPPACVKSNSSLYSQDFVEEQLSFSTADVARIEFYGETNEIPEAEIPGKARKEKFRLIDGELMAVVEEALPVQARPLTEDAGILRIIGLGSS